MATFSFKSAGRTVETRETEATTESDIPIGIMTPLRPGSRAGVWEMHFELADQIHDNLRNLILTNWGERLGVYDFGANLRELTSELVSQDNFDSEAISRIRDAVARWMPYVSLRDFESGAVHEGNEKTGIITFTITYDVPALNVQNRALQVSLFVI
jgi:phage baseplate assembly protein W